MTLESHGLAVIFGLTLGFTVGMLEDIRRYSFKQADLNGDGIKQEMIASGGLYRKAYFPDTNGVYHLQKRDFDFSSLTNLESTVEAEE